MLTLHSNGRDRRYSSTLIIPTPFLILKIHTLTNRSINQSSNQCYSTLTPITLFSHSLETLKYISLDQDQGTTTTITLKSIHLVARTSMLAERLSDFVNLSRLSVNLGHAACLLPYSLPLAAITPSCCSVLTNTIVVEMVCFGSGVASMVSFCAPICKGRSTPRSVAAA